MDFRVREASRHQRACSNGALASWSAVAEMQGHLASATPLSSAGSMHSGRNTPSGRRQRCRAVACHRTPRRSRVVEGSRGSSWQKPAGERKPFTKGRRRRIPRNRRMDQTRSGEHQSSKRPNDPRKPSPDNLPQRQPMLRLPCFGVWLSRRLGGTTFGVHACVPLT